MAKPSQFDLPLDRLATTDQRGGRVYLYPADVRGFFRRRRTAVSAVLLVVFLILPWIRIHGHPAVLLDISHGRFALFGLGFWAHEVPLLGFVIGSAILLLAGITAVWGRAWCGWGCPQTVFVDAIFRRIERGVEGDALARRRLDESGWSGQKIVKKVLKWSLFITASLVISHSFIAYFTGPEALGHMMRSSPAESPVAFVCMAGMFTFVLFDFGWFREQFCTVVCPYGRFQAVLMDETSQAVMYDAGRGEPRRGEAAAEGKTGDCVNCYRCVQVCPTGIDIRRGLQMECIACTACIDACDEVMSRTHKPPGLIRYSQPGRISTRAWVYAALLLVLGSGLVLTLVRRKSVDLGIVRAADTPYQELEGGAKILNHFKLNLENQSLEPLTVEFDQPDSLQSKGVTLTVSNHKSMQPAGESERADLFVQFPRSRLESGHSRLVIRMSVLSDSKQSIQTSLQEVPLVGPYR